MTQPTPHKVPLVFYRNSGGSEPVREWLSAMPKKDRLEVGGDLQKAQYRWPVGMPLCRPMSDSLWEIRSSLSGGKIARVLICHHMGALYALHGFIKKTQKTPPVDLKLARKRQKEVENG